MKIVVLAGGISTERDVSISTGTMVCKALRKRGHRAILVDVFFGQEEMQQAFPEEYDVEERRTWIEGQTSRIAEVKKSKKEFFGDNVLDLCREADMVFMGLHGEDGENGQIQAAFDLLGIRYTGCTCLGSAVAMDKNLSKQLFLANGVPTPKSVTLKKGEEREIPVSEIGYPRVVKTTCGGSSVGVYVVQDEKEYQNALAEAFALEEEIIVEKYIKGREFSIGVIGGEAYPIIEIAPLDGFYNYENKYVAGKTVETCPAELSEELTGKVQAYAKKAFEALRLSAYARIDFMMDEKGDFYCLEANTLPGMTPTSLLPQEAAAKGLSFEDLCEKLIEESMKKYEEVSA